MEVPRLVFRYVIAEWESAYFRRVRYFFSYDLSSAQLAMIVAIE